MIKASEIGEYVYCHRAWWLRRTYGYRSQNVQELQEGTTYHRQHGRQVHQALLGRRLALIFFFLALSVLVFWVLGQFI
ncbi:MAG: hypothetical protein WAM60_15385 [Candidatus Promineifilaceae bacterium]